MNLCEWVRLHLNLMIFTSLTFERMWRVVDIFITIHCSTHEELEQLNRDDGGHQSRSTGALSVFVLLDQIYLCLYNNNTSHSSSIYASTPSITTCLQSKILKYCDTCLQSMFIGEDLQINSIYLKQNYLIQPLFRLSGQKTMMFGFPNTADTRIIPHKIFFQSRAEFAAWY